MTSIVLTSIVAFTVIILLLVAILLVAQAKLVQQGDVRIIVNGDEKNPLIAAAGTSLLSTLSGQKIFLPSACGGGGTCAMCKCKVLDGGGDVLPTEVGHLSRSEQKEHVRLGCQVKVKQDMRIEIPEEIFGIKKWEATVVRNYNVASFIKEFVVEIPEDMDYQAGGYIQIEVPKCTVDFKDMDITAHPKEHDDPMKFQKEWDKFGLWDLKMVNPESAERAYSMASYPAEGREIMLNVRIATPPWDRANNGWMKVNPGLASSYIFSRKPGDKVTISGPYGEFFINPSDAEMLYVGGGAGMAPMRSHLYQLFKTLKTGRTVTFWYGGRSKRELFYLDHFYQLEKAFSNFKFFVVLSEPLPEDNWKVKKDVNDKEGDGFLGFVHQAVIDQYLSKHESPEEIELYFCGPPMMNSA
ncbi:MAG: NADH:ubiquinone reductase (Na(+)-transporting) subunit F, partial [Imperialibacter sp.]